MLRLLQIHLWVKKLNLFIFTYALSKTLPQFFIIIPQADKITNINKGIGHKFW